jgi:hypothetical protein
MTGLINPKNHDYVDLVSKENVLLAIEEIKLKSPVLKRCWIKAKLRSPDACMTWKPARLSLLK